jgi:hypothetical protein
VQNNFPSGTNFDFCILFLRFYTASIDCDNSMLPKAAIHYWRSRIGIGGGSGGNLHSMFALRVKQSALRFQLGDRLKTHC